MSTFISWIIDSIHHDKELELQLVVTGAHLSPEQGLTYKFIEEDGYPITAKVPMLLSCNDEAGIAKTMGVCSISMADTFNHLKPDIIVVSLPTIEFSYEACRYGEKNNVPVIVDVRDLWPDSFKQNSRGVL